MNMTKQEMNEHMVAVLERAYKRITLIRGKDFDLPFGTAYSEQDFGERICAINDGLAAAQQQIGELRAEIIAHEVGKTMKRQRLQNVQAKRLAAMEAERASE